MAYSSAWLLKKSSLAGSPLVNAVAFYILIMMASMFLGATLYLLQPTLTGLAEGLGFNMVVMTVGIIAVLHYWTSGKDEEERLAETSAGNSDEAELQRSIIISQAYVVYFLVMMASMTATGMIYIINTAMIGLDEGLIAGTAIMTPGVALVIWYALKHSNQMIEQKNVETTSSGPARLTLIFFVLLNEFVMGWTFILATGDSGISGATLGQLIVSTLSYVGGSDWFLFTLAFEILFTVFMLRKMFSREFVRIVSLQILTLVFVPTAIAYHSWAVLCEIADVLILAILFILAIRYLTNGQLSNDGVRRYLLTLLVLYGISVLGSFIFVSEGITLVLLIPLLGEIILYFNTILERIRVEKGQEIRLKPTEVLDSGQVSPNRGSVADHRN